MNRRGFIRGLGLLLAAPAIVHADNLMPVKAIPISLDEMLRQRMNAAYADMARAMNENLYGDAIGFVPGQAVKLGGWQERSGMYRITQVYSVGA